VFKLLKSCTRSRTRRKAAVFSLLPSTCWLIMILYFEGEMTILVWCHFSMSIRLWAVLKLCISRGCYIMWCGVWTMEIAKLLWFLAVFMRARTCVYYNNPKSYLACFSYSWVVCLFLTPLVWEGLLPSFSRLAPLWARQFCCNFACFYNIWLFQYKIELGVRIMSRLT